MLPLETLKGSEYFEEKVLKQGEYLFKEGDIDENIYIVYDGELSVEKKVTIPGTSSKHLGNITIGGIVGESSLSDSQYEKRVSIQCARQTTLLSINGDKGIEKLLQNDPETAFIFLKSIINIANHRLEKANKEITVNHEINTVISSIERVNHKSIQKLLQDTKTILGVEQIIYIEKNIAIDEYFKVVYNSYSKAENEIIQFPESRFNKDILANEGIQLLEYVIYQELSIAGRSYGYIVIGKEKRAFTDNEVKLLQNIATSLVGVIKQKEVLTEERNKTLLRSGI